MISVPSYAVIDPIMREAGSLVLSYYGKQLERHIKEGQGFFTEADTASEELLINRLRPLVPEAKMWAEESGKEGDAEYYWVIDPIDGTTNFTQGIPYFSISVALVHNDEPIMAAIYNPLRDELFFAQKGAGAQLNGEPIQVSTQAEMCKSVFGASVAYKSTGLHAAKVAAWHRIKAFDGQCFSLRILGSAALDLAQVSAGRLDGVFFERLSWWDIAAGMLLITEAGGMATNFDGSPIASGFENFVAGNPSLHKAMIPLLKA